MNLSDELKVKSSEYMKELARIYDLSPEVMKNFEECDNLLFTAIAPFVEVPIFADPYAYIESFHLCHAIEKHTGGRVYYGFSAGKIIVLLFVDGDPKNWEKDFPRKGEKMRVAVGKRNTKRFVISEAVPVSYQGILVFKPAN